MGKISKGSRVQLHAATDHWMRGDRYGEVVGQGRTRTYRSEDGTLTMTRPYLVKLDKSGKTVRVHPENLFLVEVYPCVHCNALGPDGGHCPNCGYTEATQ